MALKLADTAKPMGVFPVAEAVDIEITKEDETKKSLQAMYDDGELGGESLPVPESSDKLLVTVENEGELEWQQVDKDEVGSKPFIGTAEEWELLTTADKEKYDGKEVIITDDYSCENILDIYSTDEIVVGRWIDGKPIYRKVVSTNTSTTANQWVFITEIISNNINNFIKVEGICNINTSSVPLPYGEVNSQINIVATDGKVRCNVTNATYLNKPCIIIVEYTKTTD